MSTYNRKRNMRNLESFNQVDQMNMMNTNLNNLNSSPPSMDPNNMAMSVDMMSKMVGSSQDNKENFRNYKTCPDGAEVDDMDDCPEGFKNFKTCPDGTEVDDMDDCPEGFNNFKTCPDGTEVDDMDQCPEGFEDGCEADGTCYEGCPEGDENCNEGFEDGCEADGTCNQGTECTGDDCDDFTNTCADEDKDENGNCPPEPFTDTNKDMELWTCYPSNLEKSRETFESTDKYTAGGDVTYGSLGKAVASAASVNEVEMNKLYMYLAIGVIILMIIYLLTCRK